MPTYTILQRYLYRGNKTWYGRINDGGKVSYKSLKTRRKSDAQAWLDANNAARFFPELVGKAERAGHDIDKVYMEFIETKEATLGCPKSSVRYNNDIKRMRAWGADHGIKYLEDWTTKSSQDFSTWLCETSSVLTSRRVLELAKSLYKWASRRYEIDRNNPFDGVAKPKMPKRIKEFWTPEDIDKILDHAPSPELRLNWALMAFAGLRWTEACNVGPEDYADGKLHVIGKGNKEAFIPVSNRLASEIEMAGGLKVYKHNQSSDVYALKKAVSRAGVGGNKAHPHKFRHSFVSNLLRANVGAKQVQNLARHEQISTTLSVYAHLLPEDLEDAINALK